jgi:hypothetical protein
VIDENNPARDKHTDNAKTFTTHEAGDDSGNKTEAPCKQQQNPDEEFNKKIQAVKAWWATVDGTKRVEMGITALGLAALIVYTIFSIKQWAQIRYTNTLTAKALDSSDKALSQTLIKMQGQIDVASAAVKQSENQFKLDQRPYIVQTAKTTEAPRFVDLPTMPGSGQILWNWHMMNYGKSPANNISYTEEIKLAGHQFVQCHGETKPSIGPPQMTGDDVFDTVISDPISREEFSRLLGITDGISIRIKIHYTGLDGTNYESGLCLSRTNAGSITYCKNDNYIK